MQKSVLLLLFLSLGTMVCHAQATRDDRFKKKPDARKQEYQAPLTPEEKAKKEFDALPKDQQKVLLEVGKEIDDELKGKKGKVAEKDKKTAEKSAPKVDSKTSNKEPKEENITKKSDKSKKESATAQKEGDKAGSEEKDKDDSGKTANRGKTSNKSAKKAEDDAKDSTNTDAPTRVTAERATLQPKDQRPVKSKVKYSDIQLREYRMYTERVFPDPEQSDVAIALPKGKPEEMNVIRLQKAVELITTGYADKGISLMKELIKKEPKNSNYQYWMGRAYIDSYSGKKRALPYLIKASEHTDFEYNFRAPERNALAPIDALYYLGQAYMLSEEWTKADRYFKMFSDVVAPDNPLRLNAQLARKHLINAEKYLKKPKRSVSVTNLGPEVNTPYADFSAHVSSDGTELYYTSARQNPDPSLAMNLPIDIPNGKYFDDIYVSQLKDDGLWAAGTLLNIDSTSADEMVNGISRDGKQLWIYKKSDEAVDFYRSTYNFGTWQELESLAPFTPTLDWGTSFSMDDEQTVIYFASATLPGYGGYDLFYSYRRSSGKWSEPQNLGPNINTPYDETTPYLHPNKRVLFYSSNNEESMGGFDVFKSMLLGDWQRGENMGAPINSLGDDLYFSIAPDGKSAYYSRMGDDGQGDLDIYRVNFFSNTAVVAPRLAASFKVELATPPATAKGKKTPPTAAEQAEAISNEIILTNVLSGEQFVYQPNIRTGNFSVFLDPCTKYSIEYKKNGQTVRQENFVAPCDLKESDKSVIYDPQAEVSTKRVNRAMPLVDKTEANLQGYAWQLQYQGVAVSDMAFKEINYLRSNGDILATVKLDSQGQFQFVDIPDDQDYMFEWKLPEGKACSDYRIVLTKDGAPNGGISYQVVCY